MNDIGNHAHSLSKMQIVHFWTAPKTRLVFPNSIAEIAKWGHEIGLYNRDFSRMFTEQGAILFLFVEPHFTANIALNQNSNSSNIRSCSMPLVLTSS